MKKIKKVLDQLNINMGSVVAIVLTLTLLFTSGAAMGICLVAEGVAAIGGHDAGPSGGGSGGSSGGGSSNAGVNNNSNKQPITSNSQPGAKTGIVLPCATPAGNYLSAAGEGTKDISSDTEIKSGAAVLVDMTGGTVVASKNADTRIYPASMTKVMTLLVACENAKDPSAILTLTSEMVAKYNKVKGSDSQGPSLELVWKEGYQVTVEDALYMVIYGSDTYACWLLADYIAGSEDKFVELMNNRARELGFTSTKYMNCTGLFDTNHYTTCREMAAVMAAAMNNETAKTILTSISQYYVDVYVDGVRDDDASSPMWNNWYAGRTQKYPYVAPDGKKATIYVGKRSDVKFVGGKTGYETIPQATFVTAGMDDTTQRMYVCVQVNRIDETQAGLNLGEAVKQSTMDTRYIYYTYAKED